MFKDEFKESGSDRNFEQDNITGRNLQDSPLANTPVRVLTAKSIIGDKVVNPLGDKLGDIRDIMLNLRTGCIEYIVVEFGGFLGIGEKLFAVPFESMALDTEKRVFIVNKSKEELNKAPGFDKGHWPETNSRHYEDVNTFWGYTGRGPVNDIPPTY